MDFHKAYLILHSSIPAKYFESSALVQFFSPERQTHLISPFPNKPWFLRVCSTSLSKTLWENEKLLITSNFFFSHCVFHPFRELSDIFIEFEIVVCKLFQFEGVQNVSFKNGLIKNYLVLFVFESVNLITLNLI